MTRIKPMHKIVIRWIFFSDVKNLLPVSLLLVLLLWWNFENRPKDETSSRMSKKRDWSEKKCREKKLVWNLIRDLDQKSFFRCPRMTLKRASSWRRRNWRCWTLCRRRQRRQRRRRRPKPETSRRRTTSSRPSSGSSTRNVRTFEWAEIL